MQKILKIFQSKLFFLKNAYLSQEIDYSKFIKCAIWSVLGNGISRFIYIMATIIVGRYLGRKSLGELGILQSTAGMFEVFAGFGLGITATKYVAEFRTKNKIKLGRIIGLVSFISIITSVVIAVILIIIAPWLGSSVLSAPHLTNLLKLTAAMLFLSTINSVQIGVLAGFEKFKIIAKINMISGLISLPSIILGVKWGRLSGALVGLIIYLALNCSLSFVAVRKECKKNDVYIDYKYKRKEIWVIREFTIPAFLSSAIMGPVTWYCNAMLVKQPNGYAEMGMFNAANQWRYILTYIPGVLSTPLIAIMSHSLGLEKVLPTLGLYLKTTLSYAALLSAAASVLSLLSPWLMSIYGHEFAAGWQVMVLLLGAAFLYGILMPAGNMIAALGKIWLGFLMNVGWSFVLILSCYFLVHLGAKGLALSYLIAYLLHSAWIVIFIFCILKD